MSEAKQHERYSMPLCPYLAIGNQRVLIHLDAYCIPQSLQWPYPGSPDRLGWRDRFDEWPYWEELDEEIIKTRVPYFDYTDGRRDYIHEATTVQVDYIEDTNVLVGKYLLPGGATVEITTFVLPDVDVWASRYRVTGSGQFVFQGDFLSKAVRGFQGSHMGNIDFRGAFDAHPTGVYAIVCTLQISQHMGRVEIEVNGAQIWSLYMCMSENLQKTAGLASEMLEQEFDSLKSTTIAADRYWTGKARTPVSTSSLVQRNHKRWLLANKLCLGLEGCMIAAPRPFWSFVWPRDASICAAGFAAAGFIEEGQSVVKWLLDATPESRIHDARYFTDQTPMLLDNRLRQGDNPGYIAWATSFVCKQSWDPTFADTIKDQVFALADLLLSHVDPDTLLPAPESDYWEMVPAQSTSIVASAMGGLLGAAYIAKRLGEVERAELYKKRAEEIKTAASKHLWSSDGEYFMSRVNPTSKDTDVAVCLGVYPFEAWESGDPLISKSIAAVKRERWNEDAGGMLCLPDTPNESFWFYHTAIFLLGVSANNDSQTESAILASLERNITPQGLVPEQIGSPSGHLRGGNYLTTAQACLLLYAYFDRGSTQEEI